jgi:hypothetical protein
LKRDLKLSPAISEVEAIRRIKAIAAKNKVHSLIYSMHFYISYTIY